MTGATTGEISQLLLGLCAGSLLAMAGAMLRAPRPPSRPSPPMQAAPVQAVTVGFSDLDLSTAEGARALLRRINVAADEACGTSVHSPLLPRAAVQHDRCVAAGAEVGAQRHRFPNGGAGPPYGERRNPARRALSLPWRLSRLDA